jgi:hypothetical protein
MQITDKQALALMAKRAEKDTISSPDPSIPK